jgi:D-alanine-D-alanine ligase
MFKVALVYNLKRPKSKNFPCDYFSEFDSIQTVEGIASSLRMGGHKVFPVEADEELLDWLRTHRVDIVFNIAEGRSGSSRESQVPALLDFLNIPFTGSGVLSLALSLDKAKAKQIFIQQGIPTPKFQLFKSADEPLQKDLHFPLIVKPNCEGSAKGIHASNLVKIHSQLYKEIARIKRLYQQDVLAEEFIDGVELTVGILGNDAPKIFSPLEIDFTNCKRKGESFYSWEVKEYQGIEPSYPDPQFYCPARLSKKQEDEVKETALRAHRALDCLDVSRVDIRLNAESIPYVLEVNPLPGLDSQESNLTRIARADGVSYPDLVNGILESALKRYGLIDSTKNKREKVKGGRIN